MSKSQTIALVSAFPPGRQSLNEYGLHLAKGLASCPDVAEVVVIADKLPAPVAELDLGPKIRVHRVWSFNSLTAVPAILRALWSADVDSVLWNVQVASFGDREVPAALGLFGPAIARLLGWRSGVLAHNLVAGIDLESTQLKGKPIRQAIVRAGGAAVTRALIAADYLSVTLPSYEKMLKARYPNAEIHHIPHGTFDTTERNLPALQDRPKRIVTMGKFGTYKRLETMLAAFDLLRTRPEFQDYQLVIGGTDHPATPGYMAKIEAERRNDPAVIFHGYVAEDDVPDFFAQSRLSVFDYSATTGSSGVLHQAATYETIPVFPRIGDFVDLCEHEGLKGVNYTPGCADEMAAAISDILARPDEAQTLARDNRLATQGQGGLSLARVAQLHATMLRMTREERQAVELASI